MPITERTPQLLAIKSGSTTLTLSKESGKVVLARKLFYIWTLKPLEAPLSDIADVRVEAAADRASGVEMCTAMLVMRTGAGWAFPCSDRKDADETVAAIRSFLRLGSTA
jgi:hypothetical protein